MYLIHTDQKKIELNFTICINCKAKTPLWEKYRNKSQTLCDKAQHKLRGCQRTMYGEFHTPLAGVIHGQYLEANDWLKPKRDWEIEE